MTAPFRILLAIALQCLIATADPIGICLHAYSPEAPVDKIECFEFEKVERAGADYRFFPRSDNSLVVTAYRYRGTIPYRSNLAPTHPEFSKLLKLYEETARATPSTRVFLNHRILAMQTQAAQAAKQREGVGELPTITLADGSKLVGCRMTKIDKGMVSIMHQGGIRKVDIKELDDTGKKALTATADGWSLEDPSATPKDSSGTFEKIVFKNGLLLKNAKFKELSDGALVFLADGKSVSVPADQFPGELSVLGEEVVATLMPAKTVAAPRDAQDFRSILEWEVRASRLKSKLKEAGEYNEKTGAAAGLTAICDTDWSGCSRDLLNASTSVKNVVQLYVNEKASMKQVANEMESFHAITSELSKRFAVDMSYVKELPKQVDAIRAKMSKEEDYK